MELLGIFVVWPWLALVPAALFAAAYVRSHRRLAAAAALVWTLYALYEYGMHRRWLCSGDCNIRVDLLLLYPILLVMTLAAARSAIRAAR